MRAGARFVRLWSPWVSSCSSSSSGVGSVSAVRGASPLVTPSLIHSSSSSLFLTRTTAAAIPLVLRRARSLRVILLKDVEGLGFKHEEVEVKRGYAGNLLFPRQLATYATNDNRAKLGMPLRVRKLKRERLAEQDAAKKETDAGELDLRRYRAAEARRLETLAMHIRCNTKEGLAALGPPSPKIALANAAKKAATAKAKAEKAAKLAAAAAAASPATPGADGTVAAAVATPAPTPVVEAPVVEPPKTSEQEAAEALAAARRAALRQERQSERAERKATAKTAKAQGRLPDIPLQELTSPMTGPRLVRRLVNDHHFTTLPLDAVQLEQPITHTGRYKVNVRLPTGLMPDERGVVTDEIVSFKLELHPQ